MPLLRLRDWHSKVYKTDKSIDESKTPEWRKLRRAVIYRDSYHCIRCDKRFKSEFLTVHHLVPRADGGNNDMNNLVTLCGPCHDFAEINNLRTRAAIMGSLTEQGKRIELDNEPEVDDSSPDAIQLDDEMHRPRWHSWVYGGKRRRL